MNLKTACQTAMVIMLVSIPLNLLGYILIYGLMMIEHFQLSTVASALVGLLAFLLQAGGFLLFLAAILPRFKNPATNTKALVALAGILVLLGGLISIAQSGFHIFALYQHHSLLQFISYVAIFGCAFLSSLCVGIFILTQTGVTSSAKGLAAAALVVTLVLYGLVISSYIINFSQYFNIHSIRISLGSAFMSLGYLVKEAAVLLFLFAWLKHDPSPPEAGVIEPSPEPVPTFSAETDMREQ